MYRIKGFYIDGDRLETRFECILPDVDNVIEFLSRVSMEAYDVVKVFPVEYSEV